MNAFQAISGAARRVACRKRIVVIYWFAHTVMAALVALPLAGVAVPILAHSRYGAELVRDFDLMWLSEATQMTGSLNPVFLVPLLLLVGAATLLAASFLSGGAITLMATGEPYTPREFWGGCGRNRWRLIRLGLYSTIFYAIALALGAAVYALANKLWGEGMEQAPLVYANRVRYGVLITLFGFISTAMDYAKVRLVLDDSRKSFRAAFGSFALVSKNLFCTMGVWLLLLVVLAGWTALYAAISNPIETTGMAPILALLAIGQIYVLGRTGLRMMSWGAALELDPLIRPKPLPPPEPEAEETVPEAPVAEPGTAEEAVTVAGVAPEATAEAAPAKPMPEPAAPAEPPTVEPSEASTAAAGAVEQKEAPPAELPQA